MAPEEELVGDGTADRDEPEGGQAEQGPRARHWRQPAPAAPSHATAAGPRPVGPTGGGDPGRESYPVPGLPLHGEENQSDQQEKRAFRVGGGEERGGRW